MNEKTTETMLFRMPRERSTASEVLISVYESMREKGYDPINQIVGYLISGDPTYITSYNNARYRVYVVCSGTSWWRNLCASIFRRRMRRPQ